MIVGYHAGGLDEPDLERAARRLKAAGYGGVQIAGPIAKTIAQRDGWEAAGDLFRANGLDVLCAWGANPALKEWADGERGQASFAKLRLCAEQARRAKCASLMLIPESGPKADADLLRAAGRQCAAFARRLHGETGVRLSVHQHRGGVVESLEEVRRFAEAFDGVSSALLADTAHLTLGGVDPAAFATEFAGRIDTVHLKDARGGAFAFPGTGTVDFAAFFKALDRAGFDGFAIADVHDAPHAGDPVADARAWLDRAWPRAAGVAASRNDL